MGILIFPPPTNPPLPSINWAHVVVGVFFDNSPPTSSFVSNIVNNHWETRGPIQVYRTGPYFLFECQDLLDCEALLHLHTTFMDGKSLTFRPCNPFQTPTSISFSTAQIWVRIYDLPWVYLTPDWTTRLLNHVGYVEKLDNYGASLPLQPYLRALVSMDLTQPLIPGCYLPLEDNTVSWAYFRYEGIYKFCKECGCVGHNTGRCNLSAYDANRILQRRVRAFEEDGMTVLRNGEGIPLYTNMIRGLFDRFIYRNPRVNLNHILPYRFDANHDPYRFFHNPLSPNHAENDSPEEFHDASPHLPTRAFSGYSADNSQLHTNPPPDFSNSSMCNLSPSQLRERFNLSPTPGSRYAPDLPRQASLGLHPSADDSLPPPSAVFSQAGEAVFSSEEPQDLQAGLFPGDEDTRVRHVRPTGTSWGLGAWAQRSFRNATTRCLGRAFPASHEPDTQLRMSLGPLPHSQAWSDSGLLEDVVQQGWQMRAPPAPDEAGPSDWMRLDPNPRASPTTEREPPELQRISALINSRFRISPPLFADPFNPALSSHHDGEVHQGPGLHIETGQYSSTSPLDWEEMSSSTARNTPVQPSSAGLVQTTPSSAFQGKSRRDPVIGRAQSLASLFLSGTDVAQTLLVRKRRRLEDWDAKGGFNLWHRDKKRAFSSKAISDADMANLLGVEVEDCITSRAPQKRAARASPPVSAERWSPKRSKLTIEEPSPSIAVLRPTAATAAIASTPLLHSKNSNNGSRAVVGPDQPPTQP